MENLTIRAIRADDYQDFYEMASCPSVVRNTLQLPYVSLDYRKKRLEELGPDEHMLVAEVDGKVVGNIYLGRQRARRAHVGQMGMGVHDDYQGKGIGTALMAAIIDMADNWLNLKRLELEVYTDNEPAIRLYQNFGFIIEGTLKAFAFREGQYVDAYYMARVRE